MKHLWLLLLVQLWYSRSTNVAALDVGGFQTAVYPASAVVLDVTPSEAVAGSDKTAARNDYAQQARPMSGDSYHGGKAAVCADAATTCADTTITTCATETTTCATETTTCAATATTCAKKDCKNATDKIRDRVARLTDELCRAEAALTIAQQREHKLEVLEKEKNCYVKTASDKVLRLVDKLEHAEKLMAADANHQQRFQKELAQSHREADLSAHRLQVIRRLLASAEVGLVNMESARKLRSDYHKPAQQE